ncbi:MAG: sigma-70 family RNA polymerase sigma factor, partial [Planctomycetales bacterium]|nr:sigma-70 family RNA polymerase sigma factor [Planctomycetales bacterium]
NLWMIANSVLSEPQYTTLWLRYGEGLSVAEVASALGKSRVGVRALLHRARQTLKPYLAELDDPARGDARS